MTDDRTTTLRKALAWGVHAVTASGAFFGFLSLLAIERGDFRQAFLWMAVTLIIDAVDGALARVVGVGQVLPRFEGFIVDCIVDYFTYVILPVLLLYRAELLAPAAALPGAALILIVSTYHYGNLDVKAPDYFFFGFPAWWNLVVFYLYVLDGGAGANLAVVLVFAVLMVVPIKYIHPFRVAGLRTVNIVVTVLWSLACLGILYALPERSPWLNGLSLLAAAYLGGLGLFRTFRPEQVAA